MSPRATAVFAILVMLLCIFGDAIADAWFPVPDMSPVCVQFGVCRNLDE